MDLHLGIMTNAELAEWFGIKEKSFSNHKAMKLEELKNFADFEEIKGKVNITNIKILNYSKQGSKAKKMIIDAFDSTWDESGLDTCSHVGKEIAEKLPMVLSQSSIKTYTREARNQLYGIPFQEPGTLGSCKYLWCKREIENDEVKYRLLTEEEEKLKQTLIKKYFGDATEKQIFVQGMVEMGEITSEEAWGVLTELTNMKGNNFMMFLGELQERIGCQVIRGTLVERSLNFAENSEQNSLPASKNE